MGRKLYVGNLSYSVTSDTLGQLFAQHGKVESAEVIIDRMTGQARGFGFVEMGSDQDAQSAISALNGQDVEGRTLIVNEARPKAPRSDDFGGGGGGGGGGRRDDFGGDRKGGGRGGFRR